MDFPFKNNGIEKISIEIRLDLYFQALNLEITEISILFRVFCTLLRIISIVSIFTKISQKCNLFIILEMFYQ